MSLEDLILSETKKLQSLYGAIHETTNFRDRSRSANEAWRRACNEFHSYESALDMYIERVYGDKEFEDQETIQFVILFLELDPRFFRSGYIKEVMLQKIARAELNSKQLKRLSEVLLDAVDRRGGREFRRYCRLANQVFDDELISELRNRLSGDRSTASRAKMMLQYLEQASSI